MRSTAPISAGRCARALHAKLIRAVWVGRADRGAEERTGVRERAPYIPLSVLRKDSHLEMHTRGG